MLTEAAICGKTDDLRGLKENVIMGASSRPAPALPAYKRLKPGRRRRRGRARPYERPRREEPLAVVNEE